MNDHDATCWTCLGLIVRERRYVQVTRTVDDPLDGWAVCLCVECALAVQRFMSNRRERAERRRRAAQP